MWLLGIEPGSSGRTTSALNHRAVSPAPVVYLLFLMLLLSQVGFSSFLVFSELPPDAIWFFIENWRHFGKFILLILEASCRCHCCHVALTMLAAGEERLFSSLGLGLWVSFLTWWHCLALIRQCSTGAERVTIFCSHPSGVDSSLAILGKGMFPLTHRLFRTVSTEHRHSWLPPLPHWFLPGSGFDYRKYSICLGSITA